MDHGPSCSRGHFLPACWTTDKYRKGDATRKPSVPVLFEFYESAPSASMQPAIRRGSRRPDRLTACPLHAEMDLWSVRIWSVCNSSGGNGCPVCSSGLIDDCDTGAATMKSSLGKLAATASPSQRYRGVDFAKSHPAIRIRLVEPRLTIGHVFLSSVPKSPGAGIKYPWGAQARPIPSLLRD
jgi:hypothetical protein